MTKINNLAENDYVLSFNPVTQKYEYKKVLNVFNNGIKKIIEIELEDGQVHRMTPDHKILSSGGFVEAQYAEDVLTASGFKKVLKKTELPEEDVYDIEVQDNHTFCVKDKGSFAVVHNCGSQVPFSSINYGTCTTKEGQMLIESILKATDKGLGNGETSIFPVQIFKVKEGINANPGDPNYYLFELACKVSAKRMYPNFVNIDVPGNIEYYVPGKPETEMATMGALDGNAKVRLFNVKDFGMFDLRFDEVENFLVKNNFVGDPINFDENTVYYNVNNLQINDSVSRKLVNVKKFMRFETTKPWYLIKCKLHGCDSCVDYSFRATEDHPLPILGKGRTLVSDIKIGDRIYTTSTWQNAEIVDIEQLNETYVGYDFETESDRFDTENIVSHNCRTKTLSTLDGKGRTTNRGNIAFTTINLPRLGILAEHNIEKFFESLDTRITECIDELMERVNYIKTKKVCNFPFLMGQNIYLGSEKLGWNDSIEESLRNGTLAVGFIGIAEALKALTGKHHGESEESYQLALRIVKRIRERTDQATKETGWQFGCFATPAEGLSERFVKIDRKKFGEIEGVTDRKFYTNSFHIPVYYPVTAFEKMKKEGVFHEICNAGAISYIEMDGDPLQNLNAFKKIVEYSRKCGISYFSINHNVDRCPICGYQGIIETDVCPKCGWKEGTEISLEELKEKGIDIKKYI